MPRTRQLRNQRGLALSTRSPAARERYVEGLDRLLSFDVDPEGSFGEAIRLDDAFALAHGALAFIDQVRGRGDAARAGIARACSLVGGVSRREQQHVAAIAALVGGKAARALQLCREHLAEFPRDALMLSMAGQLIWHGGWLDRHTQSHALLASVADAYGDDWWFLGVYGMSHQELDRLEEARRLAERALALRPRSGGGVHALSHVFYETNDHAGGVELLGGWLAEYDRAAPYHCHLSWHLALAELAQGHGDRALEVYEQAISPRVADARTTMSDAASLLWRYQLYGCSPRSLPWAEVCDLASRVTARPGMAFADAHAVLAYAGMGDEAAMTRLVDGLSDLVAKGHPVAEDVVLPLARGVWSFGRGEYERAIELLEPLGDQIMRIGGSNAQREVYEETLLQAYLRAGRGEPAEALLRKRLDRRPSTRDARWLAQARASIQTAWPPVQGRRGHHHLAESPVTASRS